MARATPAPKLAYPAFIIPLDDEDGGGWAAEIPDLPGCMSDGRTPEEALRNIADAQEAWIETARSRGREVPSPFPEGHRAVVMRLPEDLYRRLAMKAWKNGVAVGDIVLGLLRRDVTTNDVGKLPQRVG